jgi:Reverse transcriptase (RNA-dependent DNA polymerase)
MPGCTRQQTHDATRDATQLVEENLDDFYQDCALMSAIVTGQNNEPKKFQEVWYHNDQDRQKKWRTVIRKEFRDMIKQGVWVIVNQSSIPEGQKLIGSKWVFKEKRDGRFRARLVCLGYSQIPGVDFSDNYAPVGNDVTFQIVMVL